VFLSWLSRARSVDIRTAGSLYIFTRKLKTTTTKTQTQFVSFGLGIGGVVAPHCVFTVRDPMYGPYPKPSHPSPTSLNRAAASPETNIIEEIHGPILPSFGACDTLHHNR